MAHQMHLVYTLYGIHGLHCFHGLHRFHGLHGFHGLHVLVHFTVKRPKDLQPVGHLRESQVSQSDHITPYLQLYIAQNCV